MDLHVTLLLGKPSKPGTLLADVSAALTAEGVSISQHLPHEQAVEPDELPVGSLVVHRGLHTSLTPLLGGAHERGFALCNPWMSDALLRDRRAWHEALAHAGIPVPPAIELGQWADVLAQAGADDVVVKALGGPGRGTQVLTGTGTTLPVQAPFAGPYLLEPRLSADPIDRKLYVAGSVVRGLLKRSTLVHEHVTAGVPFAPEPELVELAVEVGRVLGAHLLGVDVLRTPGGPVVVDVNGFPGFRGVADAPALVAEHIRDHAAEAAR